MGKFTAFLSQAWGVTKKVAVPVLRGVAVVFLGRKVGRIAGQAADVAEVVIDAADKQNKKE